MAFLLTHFWPGATEDRYRTTMGGSPAGGLPRVRPTMRPARPTAATSSLPSGTPRSADRFVNDVLLASMPVEGGFEGHPEDRVAEISNLQTQ